MRPRFSWQVRVTLAAVLALLAVIGFLLLWTTYMVYDDEGYVLYSLSAYVAHGHLYDQVYSQYGPFFYEFYRTLHALGLAFTNTTGREAALICWLGAAGACGAIVWRATGGQLLAAIVTMAGVFVHLWPMSSEPSHPGGLIVLLTALAASLGSEPRCTSGARAALVSAIATMLVLTKINVGVFLFIGAGSWWLLTIPALAAHPRARWLVAFATAAVPVLLMHGSAGEDWVKVFMVVAGVGTASVVLCGGSSAGLGARGRDALPAALAALAVLVVTIGLTLRSGTSWREILEGVVLGPLRHPNVYWFPITWRPGSLVLAVLSIPAALWAMKVGPDRRATALVTARLVIAAAYAACASGGLPMSAGGFVFNFGLATCWVFVLPLRESDPAHGVRTWLALLFATQALHAFPVAGSQVSWGSYLWVPLAVLGTADAAVLLRSPSLRRLARFGVVGATAAILANFLVIGWARYRAGDELRVRGAEHLRLPPAVTTATRQLVRNAEVHANVLFSLPGMMSFNAWTQLPPPTIPNATHWFSLLSEAQQQAILDRLKASPRGALIVQRYVYDLVESQHFLRKTPLVEWLLANYHPAFKALSYEFWVPNGREIVPVDAVRIFAGEQGSPFRYKVQIVLAPEQRFEAASLDLNAFIRLTSGAVGTLSNRNARFFVTPIDETGRATGPAVERHLPMTFDPGLVRIDVFTDQVPAAFRNNGGFASFRDAAGQRVAEARLIE